MIDHAHSVFGQSSSESRERGMIGRGIIEGESQELFEGDAVVDLGFQFGVGVDLEPLLQEKAFHKNYGWIGVIAGGAFTDGIVFHEQIVDSGPVDDGVDLFHSGDGPVLFDGRQRERSAKVKFASIFLKPIDPPARHFDAGTMAQNRSILKLY